MSLRFVPTLKVPTETTTVQSAPSAPGVPDRLRTGLRISSTLTAGGNPGSRTGTSHTVNSNGTAAIVPTSSHPLEARLLNWNATQKAFKLEKIRRLCGAAEPVRREMESLIVGLGEWKPLQLGGTSRVHGDILDAKDTSIDWDDVFTDDVIELAPDIHSEFETTLRMNW